MTIQDELKGVLQYHVKANMGLFARNKLIAELVTIIRRKEAAAKAEGFKEGYLAGKWDRPTNTGGEL